MRGVGEWPHLFNYAPVLQVTLCFGRTVVRFQTVRLLTPAPHPASPRKEAGRGEGPLNLNNCHAAPNRWALIPSSRRTSHREEQDVMSTIQRVQWTIQPKSSPRPWLTCNRCHAIKPFASSGKFRLNANGKRLDAWLIYRCADCESTWNRPIFERRHVKDIDPAALHSLQSDDIELVRSVAFDALWLRRKSTQVRGICRCRCAEGNSDRRERAVVGIGNRAFGSNADLIAPGPPAIYGTPPVARLYLEAREGRASPRGARERSRTSKIHRGWDEDQFQSVRRG